MVKEQTVDEGDKCPKDNCEGTLEINRPDDCYCHISPPCNICMTEALICNECGEVFSGEH